MKTEIFEQYCRLSLPLLKSGFTVGRTASMISRMGTAPEKVRTFARHLLYMMQTGCSFSYSVERYFPGLAQEGYGSLLTVFEKNGHMEKALELYLCRKETVRHMKTQLMGALIYPVMVITALLGLCLFLAVNSSLFGVDTGSRVINQALIKGGLFFLAWIFACAIWITRIFRVSQKEQFYRVMAAGLSSGSDLITCLRLGALSQSSLSPAIARIITLVEQGVPLSSAMKKQAEFSKDDLSLIEAAACNQDIARGFSQHAQYMAEKQQMRQKTAANMIEPVLLTGVGMVVLIVAKEAVLPFLTSFGGII